MRPGRLAGRGCQAARAALGRWHSSRGRCRVNESSCAFWCLLDIPDDRLKKWLNTSHTAERVLIVEDDPATRSGLTELVRTWGFTAEEAADGAEALEKVTVFRPSIVVTDLVMPRMSGIELLQGAAAGDRQHQGDPADRAGHRRHRRRGGEGRRRGLSHQAARSATSCSGCSSGSPRSTSRSARTRRCGGSCNDRGRFGRIIGHSPAMRALYQVLEQAAPTPASMLILGESGTGKELVAQTIHQLSPRAAAPFVAINCAAIPDTLLESEIFGHEKGAFTGATDRRAGCFELADRGTLFLDEIAEMTPATQVKLLRVLQERKFRRLGGRTEQEVDVRVLAATNIDPGRRRSATASCARISTTASTSSPSRCRRCASARTICRC